MHRLSVYRQGEIMRIIVLSLRLNLNDSENAVRSFLIILNSLFELLFEAFVSSPFQVSTSVSFFFFFSPQTHLFRIESESDEDHRVALPHLPFEMWLTILSFVKVGTIKVLIITSLLSKSHIAIFIPVSSL